MNIGLFFGSFNPIHVGHLIIANTIANTKEIDRVIFIVSPHNPHKKKSNLAHEFDRFDMINQSIKDNPKLFVSDIEFHMPKPSYTIDTLIRLREKYPEDRLFLILGEDNLKSFQNWKNAEQILEQFSLIVYPRPGSEPNDLLKRDNVMKVEAPLLDISATFIRESIKKGQTITYMVHPSVENFIEEKGLFLH
jgi:nicotinate-nucleotide adenylyltransferase